MMTVMLIRQSCICRLSQIPDFEGIWWLSYIAAAMSFGYVSNLSPKDGMTSYDKNSYMLDGLDDACS